MRFWPGVVIGMFAVAIAAAALWCAFQASLTVRNMSGGDLNSVTIVVAKSPIWSGDIKAGDAVGINFRPENDSDIRIEGQWQGRKLSSSVGYTTRGDHVAHEISLMPSGDFTYDIR